VVVQNGKTSPRRRDRVIGVRCPGSHDDPQMASSEPWRLAGKAQHTTASHEGIGTQGFCTPHGAQKASSNTPTLKDCRRHRVLAQVPTPNAVVADHPLALGVAQTMRRLMIALCPI
jgi:hypothetical protein